MKRVIKAIAVLIIMSLVVVPFNVQPVHADEDVLVVEINEENFPDKNFREFLLTGYHYIWDEDENKIKVEYDANHDGWLSKSEIANMKQLLIQEMPILDLTGIEYLTGLIEIGAQYSAVEKMDLTNNKNLQILNCYHAGLTGVLDLTGNSNLEGVACHNNRELTGLDVTGLGKLYNITCDNTGITALDVSTNTVLKSLSFNATDISEIDTSNNQVLEMISAYNTKLSQIDVSENPELRFLDVSGSKMVSLDVSGNTKLVELFADNNPMAWLNIGNNPNLRVIISDSAIKLNVAGDSFDITETFPGIDVNKVTIVSGAYLDGNVVSGYEYGTPIVYTYDCGVSQNGKETLKVTITLEDPNAATDDQPSSDSDEPSTGDDVSEPDSVPATGDDFSPMLWVLILVAAGAVLVGLFRSRKTE